MRYPYSLNKLGESPEALSATLRLIEFITMPRNAGECVVLAQIYWPATFPAQSQRFFPLRGRLVVSRYCQ